MKFIFNQDFANNWKSGDIVSITDKGDDYLVDDVALINKDTLLKVGNILYPTYDLNTSIGICTNIGPVEISYSIPESIRLKLMSKCGGEYNRNNCTDCNFHCIDHNENQRIEYCYINKLLMNY